MIKLMVMMVMVMVMVTREELLLVRRVVDVI